MDEVAGQFPPALRLATLWVTCDRALAWFVHVRFSQVHESEDEPPILIRPAGPITPDMTEMVRRELKQLADILEWSRASRLVSDWGKDHCAASSTNPFQMGDTLRAHVADQEEMEEQIYTMDTTTFTPMIFLNVDFFYQVMRLRHQRASQAQHRCFQFTFAQMMLHELGHMWLPKSVISRRKTSSR
jgi:hypothetical protein